MAIALEVDRNLIDEVRSGKVTHLVMEINESNQNLILENIEGNLLLVTEEMPTTYHGCYFYNGGVFPYAIKRTLDFLILDAGEDGCLARIIDIETEPGTRFNYQGVGKPIVEDANGDSCIWKVTFEVLPMLEERKAYLMRWNPAISSFTEKDYEECVENSVHGMFRMNWSIREWEEARRGDFFYMLRVGDDKAGIVFSGQFVSDSYPADDWAGSTKRRMYVDLVCMNSAEPGVKLSVTLDKLQKVIPAFEWEKGHSGILIPDDAVMKLDEMLKKDI